MATMTTVQTVQTAQQQYDLATILQKIEDYSHLPNFWPALIVATLIALCSALLGVTLVLRRFSFIGDGLSHVAFGALTVATITGVANEMLVVMPAPVVPAALLLMPGRRRKIGGGASLAMLSAGALGIGYLLMSKFSKKANVSGDVCSTLFGSEKILMLKPHEVWTSVIAAAVVLAIFIFFYNKIFAVTFDSDFAAASGMHAAFYSLVMAVVTAVVIVLAMYLVGSLLISALVVFPALSAMRVFKSFKGVVVCSAVVAVVSSLLGIFLHIVIETPIGSTIVTAQIAVFLLFTAAGFIKTHMPGLRRKLARPQKNKIKAKG